MPVLEEETEVDEAEVAGDLCDGCNGFFEDLDEEALCADCAEET